MPGQTDRIEASIVINVARPVAWEALTDTHQLGHWFGSVFDDVPVVPGAVLHARMEGAPEGQEDWQATVETVETGSVLSWRWQPGPPDLPPGEPLTLVTFTLTDEDDGTRLTVVETGFAALSRDRWELVFPMNTGGWDGVCSAISEWFGETATHDHDHGHDHDHHDHGGGGTGDIPAQIEARVVIHAPRERAWQALIDPKQLGAWFNVALENETIAPGVELRGAILHPGFEHVTWRATMESVEPPRLLSWRWHPGAADPNHDYSGEPETLCTFVLDEEEDGSTRVSFTESGFDRLPPERWAEGFGMNKDGWPLVLQAIADALGG